MMAVILKIESKLKVIPMHSEHCMQLKVSTQTPHCYGMS